MTTIDISDMPVPERLKLMETLCDSLCKHAESRMESPA